MSTNLFNTAPTTIGASNEKRKVVAINGNIHPNLPPSRAAFVPKYHRDAMADAWLMGRVSMMKLVRSNKGLGLRAIENAVRDSLMNRRAA